MSKDVDLKEEAAKFGLIGCFMVLLAPFFMVFSIVNTIIYGYVLTKLWAWLVVPLFHTEPISLIAATAIVLILGMIQHPYIGRHEKENESVAEKIWYCVATISRPWLYLLFGYIFSFWV